MDSKLNENSAESRKAPSFVSVEAALSRANTLTFIMHLQDMVWRIGVIAIFVVSFISTNDRPWLAISLILIGAIWTLSKSSLIRLINQIEQDFVAPALEWEDADWVTKWGQLLILQRTRSSSTRSNIVLNRVIRYEPILLCGFLAILILFL